MRSELTAAVASALLIASVPASAAPGKADAALLEKAVATLQQSPALEIKSKVTVTGAGEGIQRTMRERVTFARTGDGKFRAEASTATLGNQVTALYATIGDGSHAWTVAPIEGEYTMTTEAAFRQPASIGHHLGTLGLMGALLTGSDGPGASVLQDFAALASQSGTSVGVVRVDGKRLREITVLIGGNHVALFLDPRTATFGRLSFTGRAPQMTFTVVETINSQSLTPKLTPHLFQFQPPRGLRQAASIPIGFLP